MTSQLEGRSNLTRRTTVDGSVNVRTGAHVARGRKIFNRPKYAQRYLRAPGKGYQCRYRNEKKSKYKNLLYCKHNFCKLLLYGRAKESKIFTEATTNEALVMVASGSGFTAHVCSKYM